MGIVIAVINCNEWCLCFWRNVFSFRFVDYQLQNATTVLLQSPGHLWFPMKSFTSCYVMLALRNYKGSSEYTPFLLNITKVFSLEFGVVLEFRDHETDLEILKLKICLSLIVRLWPTSPCRRVGHGLLLL